jgi:protein glucosyltransferase
MDYVIICYLVSNQIIGKINKAKNEYTSCYTKNGTCFYPNILNDLEPFKNGITREMITGAADK